MTRARDIANLGTQAGSGLDASDITTGVLPVGVTGGSGLNALSASNLSAGVVPDARMPNLTGDITTSEGAVATSITADAVGTDELANDVVINTSGAITTTGAFTSVGIDDNADATAITIDSSENVGIGTTSPEGKIHSKSTSWPVGIIERDGGSDTTGASGALMLKKLTTGNMADGFGAEMQFRIEDESGTENAIASINAVRAGADNSGKLNFRTYNAGTAGDIMSIDSSGHLIHNGANTYTSSFYTSAQTVINFDIEVGSWQGMLEIQACAGYYPGTGYCCSLYGWYAVRTSDSACSVTTEISNTQNSTSSNNVGYWTVEKLNTTTLRVIKQRGGTGNYTNNPPSNTPGSTASLRGFVKVTYRGA